MTMPRPAARPFQPSRDHMKLLGEIATANTLADRMAYEGRQQTAAFWRTISRQQTQALQQARGAGGLIVDTITAAGAARRP